MNSSKAIGKITQNLIYFSTEKDEFPELQWAEEIYSILFYLPRAVWKRFVKF